MAKIINFIAYKIANKLVDNQEKFDYSLLVDEPIITEKDKDMIEQVLNNEEV